MSIILRECDPTKITLGLDKYIKGSKEIVEEHMVTHQKLLCSVIMLQQFREEQKIKFRNKYDKRFMNKGHCRKSVCLV